MKQVLSSDTDYKAFHAIHSGTDADFEADSSLGFWTDRGCSSSAGRPSAEGSSAYSLVPANRLFELYQKAKMICVDVPGAVLRKAFFEALAVQSSGLFGDFYRPYIGVDECGEFSFVIKNSVGYLDIGVSGEGIISYHVRNDLDPALSVWGDDEWDGRGIPARLVESAVEILKS
jgi:hypothetical protein